MRIRLSASNLVFALAALAAACTLFSPAFFSLSSTGFGDWQFFHHMWEAGYVALTRYGEWPLWDPYHCGGITIFGNPQSQHLSPLYLLALLAGPTLGSKLFVVVHAAIGFGGMYALARREGLDVSGALLASLTWAASGFFVSHGSGGHSAFMPFYFAPWLLSAWRRAASEPRQVLVVVLLMCLTLLEGGVYPFPYFVLLLAFDAALRLALRERPRGVLWAALTSLPLIAACGAIRLWPIVDEIARHPRTMPQQDRVALREVLEMLTARTHGWRYPGHVFVWPEYATYVGFGVLALAAVGGAFALTSARPERRWFFGLALFLALLLGDHGAFSAWSLVHRLPVYDSLRVPSRFAVLFTLYLALFAGLGLSALQAFLHRVMPAPLVRGCAWLVCAAIAVDFAVVHFPTLNRWVEPPIITDRVSGRFYLSTLSYGRHYASFPRMNLGSRGCYEAMNFTPARGLWTGDRPQARITAGSGEISALGRTTRSVHMELTMHTPGRVLLNQNFAPGWTSSVGTVEDASGLLAITLPPGSHRLALRYTPPTLVPASVLSLLGILAAVLYGWFCPRLSARWGTSARRA